MIKAGMQVLNSKRGWFGLVTEVYERLPKWAVLSSEFTDVSQSEKTILSVWLGRGCGPIYWQASDCIEVSATARPQILIADHLIPEIERLSRDFKLSTDCKILSE
jgi:hypothetical protein